MSDETRAVGDAELDRLVDGELSAAEFRELLGRLDRVPGGWRRCALAFLQAQALEADLRDTRHPATTERPTGGWRVASDPTWTRCGAALAIAAAVIAAFAAGAWWSPRLDSTGEHGPLVAGQPASSTTNMGMEAVTEVETRGQMVLSPDAVPALPDAHAESPSSPWAPQGQLTLAMKHPDGDEPQQLHLPVYAWNPATARWLAAESERIPREITRLLQQAGRELRWQRGVVPLETRDGQRVVIPIEEVEIAPCSGPRYQ